MVTSSNPHNCRLPMNRWTTSSLVAVTLAAVVWACSSSRSPSSAPTTLATPTVSAIAVSGVAPSISSSSQFLALATFSDRTTQTVTAQANWQSSVPSVATVSSTGIVTGVTTGGTDITATYQGVTGLLQITIASPSPSPSPSPIGEPGLPSRTTTKNGTNICALDDIIHPAPCINSSFGDATALCNDGARSCSTSNSGTCSSHQGVWCFVCPGGLCPP